MPGGQIAPLRPPLLAGGDPDLASGFRISSVHEHGHSPPSATETRDRVGTPPYHSRVLLLASALTRHPAAASHTRRSLAGASCSRAFLFPPLTGSGELGVPDGTRFVCNAVNGAAVGDPCRTVCMNFVVRDGGRPKVKGSAGHLYLVPLYLLSVYIPPPHPRGCCRCSLGVPIHPVTPGNGGQFTVCMLGLQCSRRGERRASASPTPLALSTFLFIQCLLFSNSCTKKQRAK